MKFLPNWIVRFLGVFLAAIACAAPRSGNRIQSTLIGTPNWQVGPIYYAASASNAEIVAAKDLADILGRITGREWTVEAEPEQVMPKGIFIGDTIAAASENALVPSQDRLPDSDALERVKQSQTFRVKVSPHSVILDGGSPEATVQAIYWFLQNAVGVRWFIPGELGEELPETDRIRLPLMDRTVLPSFYSRSFIWTRRSPEATDWERHNLLTERWQFNHNLHKVVTPDLFEEKPHWFSLVKGKLTPTSSGRGLNPNLAEPEVAHFVATIAEDYFIKKPEQRTFSISITDNINFDESPATLEIVTPYKFYRNRPDYSDLVFGFAGEVAESIWPIRADGEFDLSDTPVSARDKYLGSLAYFWAENVPSFQVHPRVIPYLTSDRAQWYSEEYREQDKALIRAWCAAGPDIIGTWDYYEGAPYYVPRNFTGIVAESIAFLYETGVRAFFAEGNPRWGFDAPRQWLAAQLLCDAEQNPEELLDTFYRGYFREAAAPMRDFYTLCEKQWMAQTGPVRWLKYYQFPSQAELYPMAFWNELETSLAKAEALAETPRVRERLALVREDFDFSRAACALYYAWKDAALVGEETMALQQARDAFATTSIPRTFRGDTIRDSLLEATEAPPGAAPESASVLVAEDFEKPLFAGDDRLWGPLTFRGGSFRDGWRTTSFHNDTFTYQRMPDFAANGQGGVRLEGASTFTLYQVLSATKGSTIQASLNYRGKLSPGSRVALVLHWIDEAGKTIGLPEEADVPIGEHTDWSTLIEQAVAPEGVEWIYLSLRVQEQMPGDFIEIDDFFLREWTETP